METTIVPSSKTWRRRELVFASRSNAGSFDFVRGATLLDDLKQSGTFDDRVFYLNFDAAGKRVRLHGADFSEVSIEPLLFSGETIDENKEGLRREQEIASESTRNFKVRTSDSNHDLPIAERIFETENADVVVAPTQVLVGDITYVETGEGWFFLAIFLDLFTRKIVGFAMQDHMCSELVIEALMMALGRQDVTPGECLTHTDRLPIRFRRLPQSRYGGQSHRKYVTPRELLRQRSLRKLFRLAKNRTHLQGRFKTRSEAKQAIFEWIETWYNRKRLHSLLGYMTPEKLALAS